MFKKIPMTAVILAGGKSSRMGRDKALLAFGENTMLEFLNGLLTSLFTETLIIVNQKKKCEALNLAAAKIHEDIFPGKGPLAGLYTALVCSHHEASCVFTCDMPLVDEVLIHQLAGFWRKDYDVLCLEDCAGRLEPFPGIYLRSSRQMMRLLLDAGKNSMQGFLEIATVKTLVLQEERIRILTNMNTLEDYYQVLKEKKERVSQ